MALYDDIAAKDRSLADRWRIRTRGRPQPLLTAADIDYIVANLSRQLRGRSITEAEATALVLMINASIAVHPDRSWPGVQRLGYYVDIWEKALKLNLEPIVGDDKLLEFADFLRGGVVSRVMFRSPGTSLTYAPFDYIAVGQLVFERKVKLFYSNTAGLSSLSTTVGVYHTNANILIFNSTTPGDRLPNIIHESTHIIQDWQDLNGYVHDREADAFIAEWVARRSLEREYPISATLSEVNKVSLAAADHVIANRSIDDPHYRAVVREVAKVYKQNGVRATMVEAGEGTSEADDFKVLRRYVENANKVRDVVLDEVARVLKRAVP